MAKSVIGIGIGLALSEGRIRSLDDLALAYVPQMNDYLAHQRTTGLLVIRSSRPGRRSGSEAAARVSPSAAATAHRTAGGTEQLDSYASRRGWNRPCISPRASRADSLWTCRAAPRRARRPQAARDRASRRAPRQPRVRHAVTVESDEPARADAGLRPHPRQVRGLVPRGETSQVTATCSRHVTAGSRAPPRGHGIVRAPTACGVRQATGEGKETREWNAMPPRG